ncbi:Laminin G domain [Nesidiocoris tenuis]|uniref:Laminin G domain n=1 Tax=Nesidiocoris tenuis TaxID=355587 RepID=A0ABN7B3M8_9HEMI|nr:Laminin G domain [Nesidiocoris tenuis]
MCTAGFMNVLRFERFQTTFTSFQGLRDNSTDACEEHDPCQHGGICISTDSGPICECRNLDYEGIFCEKDKAPSEATFRGVEYLYYDLSRTGGEPIVSTQDSISLFFKTRHPSGLLFHTGDNGDYLNLGLRDGGIVLSMNLGNGKLDLQIKPKRVRFDDNQWHKLTVHRRVQEISAVTSFCRLSLVVDGVYAEHSNTAGTFTMLSSSRAYVGGTENVISLTSSKVHNNFVGCLRKVEFNADTLRLNLIELARTGSKLVGVAGHVDFMCQEVEAADPITFTTPSAHLLLPTWDAPRTGSVSVKLRTTEPNGLLMFSQGSNTPHADLFAVELVEGHLWLHLDLGSGPAKIRGTTRRVDDGSWHELTLKRTGKQGRLTVDGNAADFSTPGDSNQLDLEGGLYVGGLSPSLSPPPTLWSAVLSQGFVGCIRDLVLNGKAVDIAQFARAQDSSSIQPACHRQAPQCDSSPCMSGGLCTEGWNRFVCDCSATTFTGPTCGKEATTLTFNGSQHMTVRMSHEMRSQAEEVRLRFRTTRPSGLLLATSTEQIGDRLQVAIFSGRLRLHIRLGEKEKTLQMGQGMNDNQWHSVSYSRRAEAINLQVDAETPIRVDAQLGRGGVLEYTSLHVGGLYHDEEEIQMTSPVPNFVGSMQQFTYNGVHYFEQARTLQGAAEGNTNAGLPRIQVTATFSKRDHQLVHHPVTFKSKHTFVGLPVLKAYSGPNIYFQFKTREPSGLILYNAGREQDFIAIELQNGHIVYTFDLGDGSVRVKDNARSALNDNKWHSVTVGRPAPRQHTLMVDETMATVSSRGQNDNLDLGGILYLGGLPKDGFGTLPKMVTSKHGYEGCLASLDLNGESPNIIEDAVVPSSLVSSGCDGPSTKCSHNICSNRGVCVQQWNSYTCDCDMTSYTGPRCTEESIAYEFGPNRGLVTYVFPEDRRPEMKSDVLALGFITDQDDAVLFRVDSGTSNDYMELEIVEGNIFMVYNMGTNDHPIGEINVKVNDNQYHVVRFTRSGANSTIQIDDYNVQTNHPAGHQLSVFNSQAQIQVGGKWNRAKQKVERPFVGVMAGLVLNGLRILDLAAEQDPKTEVRGDVTLLPGIRDRLHEPYQRMQQTPASGYPGVMDDLVFSGAGSGCNDDDEDKCTPAFETGSGDDLITPVYVPPTRPPAVSKNVTRPGGKICENDDEDCLEGSGLPATEDPLTTAKDLLTTLSGTTRAVDDLNVTEDSLSNTTSNRIIIISSETTGRPAVSFVPIVVPGSSGPGDGSSSSLPPSGIGGGTPYGGHTTPVDVSSGSSSTSEATKTPTTPSTTTTTEAFPLPPAPPPSPPVQPPFFPAYPPGIGRDRSRDRISSAAAENTALIIGIIAGAMIAIILIILIVLKLKNRSSTVYKVEESKAYGSAGQGQNAALLNQSPPTPQAVNGAINGKSKARQTKDVKEWYV